MLWYDPLSFPSYRAAQKLNLTSRKKSLASDRAPAHLSTCFREIIQKNPPPVPSCLLQAATRTKDSPSIGKVDHGALQSLFTWFFPKYFSKLRIRFSFHWTAISEKCSISLCDSVIAKDSSELWVYLWEKTRTNTSLEVFLPHIQKCKEIIVNLEEILYPPSPLWYTVIWC